MKKGILFYIISVTMGVILRALLRLRYRVVIYGLDSLDDTRGWFILPNHPAEVDPVIIVPFFWPTFQPRPVLLEDVYNEPYAKWLLWCARAIPIPDLEKTRSIESVRKLKAQLATIVDARKEGDNILMYPSGRLYRDGVEKIGNASGVHLMLQRAPDARVLLVRTRGLWGSSFSCAHGNRPNVGIALLNGLKVLLFNGIFFAPRRKIVIDCMPAPDDFPQHGDRLEINTWLEEWYNRDGVEEKADVPAYFWQKKK